MIVFVDVETTGLNPQKDVLLEVAFVVTDDNLVEQAFVEVVIRGGDIKEMIKCGLIDPIVVKMHTDNGLFVFASSDGMELHAAQDLLVSFVKNHFSTVPKVEIDSCIDCRRGKKEHDSTLTLACPRGFYSQLSSALPRTPLAGSTVGFDRAFLKQHMPELEKLFSYRSIDVSSLTELAQRWALYTYVDRPKAGKAHRALADVRESIAYLNFYRERGFVSGECHPSTEGKLYTSLPGLSDVPGVPGTLSMPSRENA